MCLESYARDLLRRLCRKFPMGYEPTLTWKNLRVTAGVAYYKRGEIALSRIVLTDKEKIRLTLTHEYAHLLAVYRYGQKGAGHGAPWKEAMLDLGLEPKVLHDYPCQRNAKRQLVVYQCLRCGTKLKRARQLPKRRKYVHATCGGALRLQAVRRIEAA